ncbi:hypothetical protein BVRB_5g103330 [Beta vulgaris subsp. vulgaris]|nr:hypothetical protein BVRB_5g103330 [Beta vulgaris subsp. vulgaris]
MLNIHNYIFLFTLNTSSALLYYTNLALSCNKSASMIPCLYTKSTSKTILRCSRTRTDLT